MNRGEDQEVFFSGDGAVGAGASSSVCLLADSTLIQGTGGELRFKWLLQQTLCSVYRWQTLCRKNWIMRPYFTNGGAEAFLMCVFAQITQWKL